MFLHKTEPGAWDAGPVAVRSAGKLIHTTDSETDAAYQAPLSAKQPGFLTADDERSLTERYRLHADVPSRNRLILSFMPLVRRIAASYQGERDDLEQAGVIGLLKAAEKYDPDKSRFSTYATWWIKAELRDYRERNLSVVKPPSRTIPSTDVSLNERVEFEDGSSERIELLADDSATDPWKKISEDRAAAELSQALDVLTGRELRVFTARRLADEPATLEVLANELGVSRERIRQIEVRAAEKARLEAERIQKRAPKRTGDHDIDVFLADYYRYCSRRERKEKRAAARQTLREGGA